MAADSHKNFAYSTVATAPTPADSGTSLIVASGGGLEFPTPPFNATVWAAGAQPTTAITLSALGVIAANSTVTILPAVTFMST